MSKIQNKVHFNKCKNCDVPVESYEMYDAGYHEGYRSRNYRTLITHEERKIGLPEYKTTSILICHKCLKESPDLDELKLRLRLEWYQDQIDRGNKRIDKLEESRKDILKKKRALKNWLRRMEELKGIVTTKGKVTGPDIPKCPVDWELRWDRDEE